MRRRFIPSENAPLLNQGQGILLVLALLLLPFGCGRGNDAVVVQLPVTPVAAARPGWAVSVNAYARVRSGPTRDAEILGHLRLGDVAEVVSLSTSVVLIDGVRDRWVEISSGDLRGWVRASEISLYESLRRAELAAAARGGP
jgi:hypothetical protein